MKTDWTDGPAAPPRSIWWWAVLHLDHPAFYMRALMPGDFGPESSGPLPRHVCGLDGVQTLASPVVCGTCGQVPRPEDLEPLERATGRAGFLAGRRAGRQPWPRSTDPASCWCCSNRQASASIPVRSSAAIASQGAIPGLRIQVQLMLCASCAAHVEAVAAPIAAERR